VRQQGNHAKAAAAASSIAFSVSIRGVHWMCEDAEVAAAMAEVGKLHSIKVGQGQYRFATKNAYANFSGGN
jgi:hypothetical protein